jgi:hypothetical protein
MLQKITGSERKVAPKRTRDEPNDPIFKYHVDSLVSYGGSSLFRFNGFHLSHLRHPDKWRKY